MPFEILQPGAGPIRAATYLPADPSTVLWGRLPCAADEPVLTIDPGTEVTIDTISHEGILDDQGSDARTFFARHGIDPAEVLDDAAALSTMTHRREPLADGPHVITGPIAVRGAEVGDVLTMTVIETVPRVPYGFVSNRHGRGALAGEYPVGPDTVSILARVDGDHGVMARSAAGGTVTFPLAPFLGVMGVAVPGDERPHSVPPGHHGGNIDIRLLTAGSRLHLPVLVPGALAYVGDPHFAQGDGEVALTALEASLRVTVRFDLVPAAEVAARFGPLDRPLVETDDWLCPTGVDVDLDEAVREAVRASIALLTARFDMDAEHALAYLSAATDFNISQVVDRVSGVHARIRKADFA